MPITTDNRSIVGLFTELTQELSTLVRKEVQLAKAEVGEKVSQVGRGVASMGIGSALLFAGFLSLIASAIFSLALIWPLWLSALAVAAVCLVIGGAVTYLGKKRLEPESLRPRRTIDTLRDDKQWVKEQVK